jgi:hypothetical protein
MSIEVIVVLFIYVFFWVLVWPCQLFVRLWYRVSDVLNLSLVSKRFGFWPHITHVIVLTFKEIKHLSDYRIIGLSDYRSDPHKCKYPVYFLVATTSGFIQVACSRVQPRKVTIEKKDEINEYKKKEIQKKGKDKKKSVPVSPAIYLACWTLSNQSIRSHYCIQLYWCVDIAF